MCLPLVPDRLRILLLRSLPLRLPLALGIVSAPYRSPPLLLLVLWLTLSLCQCALWALSTRLDVSLFLQTPCRTLTRRWFPVWMWTLLLDGRLCHKTLLRNIDPRLHLPPSLGHMQKLSMVLGNLIRKSPMLGLRRWPLLDIDLLNIPLVMLRDLLVIGETVHLHLRVSMATATGGRMTFIGSLKSVGLVIPIMSTGLAGALVGLITTLITETVIMVVIEIPLGPPSVPLGVTGVRRIPYLLDLLGRSSHLLIQMV